MHHPDCPGQSTERDQQDDFAQKFHKKEGPDGPLHGDESPMLGRRRRTAATSR